MYEFYIIVIAFMLVVAAIFDVKTMEVPISLSLCVIATSVMSLIVADDHRIIRIWSIIIVFVFYMIVLYVGRLGGADALLMVGIAGILGADVIMVHLLAYTGAVIYLVCRKEKDTEYPFVPFIAASFIVIGTVTVLQGGYINHVIEQLG